LEGFPFWRTYFDLWSKWVGAEDAKAAPLSLAKPGISCDEVMRMISSCVISLARAWKSTQVEHQGQYSIERLFRLKSHCDRTSTAQCALVLAVTPLPCLLITLMVECIPMENPKLGVDHSLLFFARILIVTVLVDFLVLNQCRLLFPDMPSSSRYLVVSACIAGVGAISSLFVMACMIGFPLPLTSVLGSPVSCLLLGVSGIAMWGDFFRQHTSERQDLISYIIVVGIQVTMTYVYPAYAFVFARLSGLWQIPFALLLPLLKRFVKTLVSYLFRDKQDIKADMVVLNANIYHVLFISWCMNGSRSVYSTLFFVLLDLVEAILAYVNVSELVGELMEVLQRPDRVNGWIRTNPVVPSERDTSLSLLNLALAIWEHDKASSEVHPGVRRLSTVHSIMGWRSTSETANMTTAKDHAIPRAGRHAHARVAVVPQSGAERDSKVTTAMFITDSRQSVVATLDVRVQQLVAVLSDTQRGQCLQLVLRLLHTSEFLLLAEFIEMVIPAIYCTPA